jgi:mono/diheme cytochrome c family protein
MSRAILISALSIIILLLIGVALLYSGIYNVAADEEHWRLTSRLMQTIRSRSVERHARDVKARDLAGDQVVIKGAGHYAQMCVMCHLAPGIENTELRQGLYPQPPNLTQLKIDPAAAFWVIKHGIKMTGMPAWGASHDDDTIWSIVAFVEKLPGLTPQQYKEFVDKATPDEQMSEQMSPAPKGSPAGHPAHTHSHSKSHRR